MLTSGLLRPGRWRGPMYVERAAHMPDASASRLLDPAFGAAHRRAETPRSRPDHAEPPVSVDPELIEHPPQPRRHPSKPARQVDPRRQRHDLDVLLERHGEEATSGSTSLPLLDGAA